MSFLQRKPVGVWDVFTYERSSLSSLPNADDDSLLIEFTCLDTVKILLSLRFLYVTGSDFICHHVDSDSEVNSP